MNFPISRFIIRGQSMEPAFRAGDYVLVNRRAKKLVPGDVVVLRDPREPQRKMLKRINGVTDAGYIVSGDNRMGSTDSKNFGSVPKADIIGKVLFRS
jgi:nickel-type superoxide dismutase maturation protease